MRKQDVEARWKIFVTSSPKWPPISWSYQLVIGKSLTTSRPHLRGGDCKGLQPQRWGQGSVPEAANHWAHTCVLAGLLQVTVAKVGGAPGPASRESLLNPSWYLASPSCARSKVDHRRRMLRVPPALLSFQLFEFNRF